MSGQNPRTWIQATQMPCCPKELATEGWCSQRTMKLLNRLISHITGGDTLQITEKGVNLGLTRDFI